MDAGFPEISDEELQEVHVRIEVAREQLERGNELLATYRNYPDVGAVLSSMQQDLRLVIDFLEKIEAGEEPPEFPEYHYENGDISDRNL